MNFRTKNKRLFFTVGALVGAISFPPASSNAATATQFGSFKVIVTNQQDTPIGNVSLCIAMPGQSVQKMTDQSGVYSMSLPVGSTTIRFAKDGYVNTQDSVSMTNGSNIVRQIRMQTGTSSPLPSDCSMPGYAVGGTNSCNTIDNLQIDTGTTTTDPKLRIRVRFTSLPAYFRITEFSASERYSPSGSFDPERAFEKKNVAWQANRSPFDPLPTTRVIDFTLTEQYFGTHVVYLQTRRSESGCVSSVSSVSVILAPAKLETYTLTGKVLQNFVQYAKSLGYQFNSTFEFRKKGNRCASQAMQVPYPMNRERWSDHVEESIDASYQVFLGPDMPLYWTLKRIRGSHPDLPQPLIQFANTKYALEFDPQFTGYSSPFPNWTTRTIKAQLNWRRYAYDVGDGPTDVQCIIPSRTPELTEVVLEGPAGLNPVSALVKVGQ